LLSSDVVIEYCGQEYRIPWLLVGSARSKLTDRVLSDELEEAMEGRRSVVVIHDSQALAFYTAARKISVSLERANLDWQRLLAQLDVSAPRERSSLRSQILGELPRRDIGGPVAPARPPTQPRPVRPAPPPPPSSRNTA
jgi:hypothetical protein